MGGRGGGKGNLALRLLPWAVLAMAVALVFATGLNRHLSISELRDRRVELQGAVRAHPVLSLEVYAGLYALVVALSIPGALVMSLGGGYFFGVLQGAPTAIAGETVGAVVMFLLARSTFGASFMRRFVRKGGWVRRMTDAVKDEPFTSLLMLRLIPAVPFAAVNIVAGLVRMPVLPYVAATLIGITPSTVIYCWVGQGLGVALDRNGTPKLSSLITPQVYLPLGLLGLMGVTAFAWRMRRRRAQVRSERPT